MDIGTQCIVRIHIYKKKKKRKTDKKDRNGSHDGLDVRFLSQIVALA